MIACVVMSNLLLGQSTYFYELDDANLHITPEPLPVAGVHPPTDYSNVSKPLVVEAYADNIAVGADADTIHPGASGVLNAFFGGDQPGDDGYGSAATPILTRQTFSTDDFPIYLESNFYSESNIPPYDEHYFCLVPADYSYYGSPTYYVNGNELPREGFLIGGRPFESWITINRSIIQTSVTAQIITHNNANNGAWYNFKAVLDISAGDLVIREMKVNDNCLLDTPVAIVTGDQVPDEFRIGLCVDDLAKGFRFITGYRSLTADFAMPDTICPGTCANFTSEIRTEVCSSDLTTQWSFPGAIVSSSTAEHPIDICYPVAGKYQVTLEVDNTVERDTVTKEIIVMQETAEVAIVEPGLLCSGYDPLQLEVSITGLPDNLPMTWSGAGVDSLGMFDPKAVPAGVSTVGVVVENQGCQYAASVDIEIVEQPTADFTVTPTHVCLDTAVHLVFTGRATSQAELIWDLDSGFVATGTYPTDFGVQWTKPGMYLVRFRIEDRGCIASTGRDILVSAQLDTPEIVCHPESINSVTVEWEPVSGATHYSGFSDLGTGSIAGSTYTVSGLPDGTEVRVAITAEGAPGCAPVSSEITCRTLSLIEPEIFIPNVFSPDGNGINDIFYVQTNDGVVGISGLRIFDRWGNLVFEMLDVQPNNPGHGWDGMQTGTTLAPGVYFYEIRLRISDGSEINRAGNVTLVR
jgi:gliding motility-associated-like protein